MCFTWAWPESGCHNSAAIMAVAAGGDEPKGAGSGTIISTGSKCWTLSSATGFSYSSNTLGTLLNLESLQIILAVGSLGTVSYSQHCFKCSSLHQYNGISQWCVLALLPS